MLSRITLLAMMLVVGIFPLSAQRSAGVMLYDDFFHAANIAVELRTEADTTAYTLVVTYDEGDIRVFEGSELTFVMRDKSEITLRTDRRTTRADVTLRRFPDRDVRLLTCHYPITAAQLAIIVNQETRRLDITTSQARLRRYTRHLPLRMQQALRSLRR